MTRLRQAVLGRWTYLATLLCVAGAVMVGVVHARLDAWAQRTIPRPEPA